MNETLTTNPEPTDSLTGKWCWSTDEEGYHGCHDTRGDAEGEAQENIDSDEEPGVEHKYWVAQCCHPLDAIAGPIDAKWIGEDIDERMQERIHDEVGGDDDALSLSEEDHTELGELVLNFLRARAKVMRFGIKNPVQCTYVSGSNE